MMLWMQSQNNPSMNIKHIERLLQLCKVYMCTQTIPLLYNDLTMAVSFIQDCLKCVLLPHYLIHLRLSNLFHLSIRLVRHCTYEMTLPNRPKIISRSPSCTQNPNISMGITKRWHNPVTSCAKVYRSLLDPHLECATLQEELEGCIWVYLSDRVEFTHKQHVLRRLQLCIWDISDL